MIPPLFRKVVVQPFDIPIGRCTVVADPWDNWLVLGNQDGTPRVTNDLDGGG